MESPNDLLIGSGKVYVGVIKNGVQQGEFHLGNCSSFTLQTTDEKTEKYSSMDKERPLIGTAVKKREVTLKIVGDYFNEDNVLLLTLGSIIENVQASGTVTDEVVTSSAVPGRFYPLKHKNVSALVVKAGGTTVASGYTYDPVTSRLFIHQDSTIELGDEVTVSYTYPSVTKKVLAGGTETKITAFVRYVSDNTQGTNKHVQVWTVDLTPDAEIGFITEDWASWSMTGRVLADKANHPEAPYYTLEEI